MHNTRTVEGVLQCAAVVCGSALRHVTHASFGKGITHNTTTREGACGQVERKT